MNAACTQEVTDMAVRQGHGSPNLDRFALEFKLYPITAGTRARADLGAQIRVRAESTGDQR
ncbi:hypothetical protein TSO5_22740 [Azospirillum sp. TSO5]|nr:hypothetical protein TSO5_22740 [Azospirillum sp. TSO5]